MQAPRPAPEPFLRLEKISKVYPGVAALSGVDLDIRAGEVLALIGENGAGKSTLMKILGGLIAPSAGRVVVDGVPHDRLTVAQSHDAGIAFVHQELNVFDNLDVAANLFLGREARTPLGLLDIAAMKAAAVPILARVGALFGPDAPVASLSLAERQLLEIARAVSVDARVVIMDEPTSSLTLAETRTLMQVIADLRAQGVSIIYISHRLGEVQDCADRVVVLRDGRIAGTLDRSEASHDAMIRMMIGRDLKSLYLPPKRPFGEAILSAQAVRIAAKPHATVTFDVREGEILGIAGLVGAGRTELAEAIFGIGTVLDGEVTLLGRSFRARTPAQAIAAGLYLVPEDRKRTGLLLESAIADNISLADLASVSSRGLVSDRAIDRRAEAQRTRLGLRAASVRQRAAELSGGNQQKVVLGKWLAIQPRLIIFDEPTRGIDVGAKSEIYQLMRDLADRGVGVVMISSDMEEVIGVSDRILVLREGAVAGALSRSEFSEHSVLRLAVGA